MGQRKLVSTGVWLALLFLAQAPAPVDAEQLAIRRLDLRDGLAHPRVSTFYRDSFGYLWIGTWEGLSRFDGDRFVSYGVEDGLPDAFISDITEDDRGQLWVATHGGGVAVLLDEPRMRGRGDRRAAEPARTRFVAFDVSSTREGNAADRLFVDPRGRLWCKSHEGIHRGEIDEHGEPRFTLVWAGTAEDAQLDARGRLWAMAGADIVVVDEDHVVRHEGVVPDDFGAGFDHAIAPDGEGGWLAMYRRAVVRMHLADDSDDRPSWTPLPIAPPEGHVLRSLAVDPAGPIWVGTTAGLIRWTPERTARYDTTHGLPDDYILSLFVTGDGVVWGGTHRNGAFRLLDEGLVSYTAADGLPDTHVTRLVEGRDGTIYASTGTGGVVQVANGLVTRVPGSDRPPFDRIGQRLSRTRRGDWLVGTAEGLYWAPGPDLDLRRARPVPPAGERAVEVFGTPHEHADHVWFSTPDDDVYRAPLDQDGRPQPASLAASLGPPRQLFTTRAGTLWAAPFVGLWRWREDAFDPFEPGPDVPDPHVNARVLHQDRAGRLWIGLRSHGVVVTDEPEAARPRFEGYSTATGLASNAVWCIAEDHAGRLYFGTARGVSRLDPASGAIRHISTVTGLAGDIVNHCIADADGRIWIGTTSGISRLDPRADEPTPAAPSVLVTRVTVAGRDAALPERGTRLAAAIDVPRGHDRVHIEYAAIHRWPEPPVRYQYRLDGLDEDWSDATDLRAVQYASLAPGAYTFRVRAIGVGGISPEPARVTFHVLPPIWQRWWFLLGVAGLAVGSGWGARRVRLQRALAMERIRRQIATDLHDEMGSGLSQVAILSELGRRAVPESAATFVETARLARSMRDAMSDIVWAVDPHYDYVMDLIRRMREAAFNLLEAEGLDVAFHAPADVEVNGTDLAPDRRRHLLLIFKEALTNIARHARASAVRIDVALPPGALALGIEDDGVGFDPGAASTGHGLASLRSRAAALGAALTVDSAPGRGTRLRLLVPLHSTPVTARLRRAVTPAPDKPPEGSRHARS